MLIPVIHNSVLTFKSENLTPSIPKVMLIPGINFEYVVIFKGRYILNRKSLFF